jgi:hypothetical protein
MLWNINAVRFFLGKVAGMDLEEPNCAQNVPVKVKYLQTFPNETKNADRITHRFNILKINEI